MPAPSKRTVSSYELGKLGDEAAAAAATAAAAIPKSLASAADQGLYSTGVGTWAAAALTSFGRSIWAAVDAAALKLIIGMTKADVGLGSVDNVQQLPLSYLDTDGTLAANSDTRVPSQKAIKTYADLRYLKTGGTISGPVTISSNWSTVAGIFNMTGADPLGFFPWVMRNTDLGVNAQCGYDIGFDLTHRVTMGVARSGQAAPFTSSAYFWSIGQSGGLRFLTGDATNIAFYTNSTLRGLFKSTGPLEVGARTSSTSSDEAKQVIFGGSVNSTTPQVMLRLVTNENPGLWYPGSVDFLCYSYGTGGVGDSYRARSVLEFRLKDGTLFGEATSTTPLKMYADGSVFLPALSTADCLLKTSGTGGLVAIDTGLTFAAARLTTPKLTVSTDIALGKTITAPGTTGAQTINKSTGRVNFAIGATSLVVTNSLVTANSIIQAIAATNDATGRVTAVVAAASSFTIYCIAPTAEMAVNFLVTN